MRRFLAWLLTLAAAVSLCGCSGEVLEEYTCPSAYSELAELVDAAREDGHLTVCADEGSLYVTALCQRFQELFGVEVTCRVAAAPERSSDVWLGSVSTCRTLAENGKLEPYDAVNAANLTDASFRGDENHWYVVGVDAVCFMVNTAVLRKMEISTPRQWEDLTDRVYRELVWMPDYGTSELGTAVALNAALVMGQEDALSYLTTLDTSVAFYTDDEGEAGQCVTSGECVVGVGRLSDGLTAKLSDGGDDVRLLVPSGAISWNRGGGVLTTAAHPSAARLWQEFLLTADCADVAADNGCRTLPTVAGADLLEDSGVTLRPAELTEWTETMAAEAETMGAAVLEYMAQQGIDTADATRFPVS